jgi:BirA family transcriptional regulator, biotin operon repressor / biotin---[acetyl-CoA-carboxylase] ligase
MDRSWSSALRDPRVVEAVAESGVVTEPVHRASVSSTQDVALGLVRDGAHSGLLVLADRQLAGRGRRGRVWDDSEAVGASLALTLVIDIPERGLSLVPHAVGLALHDAVSQLGARGLALKWPNDLVATAGPGADEGQGGLLLRKLAGILVERERAGERDVLLVGVGVNVASERTDAADHPERIDLAELLRGAPVVAQTADVVDQAALLAALVRAFDARLGSLDDGEGLLHAYRARCETIGREVGIELPDGATLHGRATGIDGDGHLILDVDGVRHVVIAATVR